MAVRAAPARHFVDVITNGYGVMYPYAARVAPQDRWAIAAYIRALQLSQGARLASVPRRPSAVSVTVGEMVLAVAPVLAAT